MMDSPGEVKMTSQTMETHNAKLPVWLLTPKEEKEARKRWKDHAYKECDEVVQSKFRM